MFRPYGPSSFHNACAHKLRKDRIAVLHPNKVARKDGSIERVDYITMQSDCSIVISYFVFFDSST